MRVKWNTSYYGSKKCLKSAALLLHESKSANSTLSWFTNGLWTFDKNSLYANPLKKHSRIFDQWDSNYICFCFSEGLITSDMCAQRKLRSACASAQTDQSLRCPHVKNFASLRMRRLIWIFTGRTRTHYENTPIQMYWKFYHLKWKFSHKISDIFHISAQSSKHRL